MLKYFFSFYSILFFFFSVSYGQKVSENDSVKYVLVIHGGAGTLLPEKMSADTERAYRQKLEEALQVGYQSLKSNQSSVDAVIAAIQVMEDSPLFNAGKGAVMTHEGKNELDASIMDGKTRNAGAVAGITTVKSPIQAARTVMEKSGHVMLSGKGAEEFAAQQGLEIVSPDYFWTERRWKNLQKTLKKNSNRVELDHDEKQTSLKPVIDQLDSKFGTVGAVARDMEGNLAAGTSTGGMNNKRFGRIGDSPIIGAGNFANNQVAISCTGWGEFYIRTVAAHNVAMQMKHLKLGILEASQNVIDEIGDLGGTGGIIAIDRDGKIAMPFNTAGMYRGTVDENGVIHVEIFK